MFLKVKSNLLYWLCDGKTQREESTNPFQQTSDLYIPGSSGQLNLFFGTGAISLLPEQGCPSGKLPGQTQTSTRSSKVRPKKYIIYIYLYITGVNNIVCFQMFYIRIPDCWNLYIRYSISYLVITKRRARSCSESDKVKVK